MADLSKSDHLPNLRDGREPPPPSWLPRQRRGITPQMIGRYPDYDVFDAQGTWDAATAKVVAERMQVSRRLSFFSDSEVPTVRAFCDVCVFQDSEPRIPVVEMIDEKLAAGRLDGYQYADMPDDRDTWHLTLAGLNEVAATRHDGLRFAELGWEAAEAIVGELSKGTLKSPSFERLNVSRAWSVCMRMVLAAFYSHPWAWNEIGFGGPAYPRGYMRLGPTSTREPFETRGATDEDPVQQTERMQQ
jgi:hypothetical protein